MYFPIAKQSRAYLACQQEGDAALFALLDMQLDAAIKSLGFDLRRYTDRSAPRNDLYADLAHELLVIVARLDMERARRVSVGVFDWALTIGYQSRTAGAKVPPPYNNRGTCNSSVTNRVDKA